MGFEVTSSSFPNGGRIPKRHTGEGEDVSPAIAWDGVPPGTKTLALVCDDPDAPRERPFVHWVLYDVPHGHRSIRELRQRALGAGPHVCNDSLGSPYFSEALTDLILEGINDQQADEESENVLDHAGSRRRQSDQVGSDIT